MKAIILAVFLFFSSVFVFSQTQKSLECVDKTYSVVVHIVKDNTKNTNYSLSSLYATISRLNNEWMPICVQFNVCDIRYIENYNFDDWDEIKLKTETLALFAEPRHINVFIVQSSVPNDNGGFVTQNGVSLPNKDLIVITKTASSEDWVHLFGHYFGLLHTYEPGEKVDGSNCSSAGDFICDTPADPKGSYSSGLSIGCEYYGTNKDVNNQIYKPLLENFMSGYIDCRFSFTHQQYERMINTLKINPSAKF